jgi:hypothetical protein
LVLELHPRPFVLGTVYRNATEFLTELFQSNRNLQRYNPAEFQIVGSVTAGSGRSASRSVMQIGALDQSRRLSLAQIKAAAGIKKRIGNIDTTLINLLKAEELPNQDGSPPPTSNQPKQCPPRAHSPSPASATPSALEDIVSMDSPLSDESDEFPSPSRLPWESLSSIKQGTGIKQEHGIKQESKVTEGGRAELEGLPVNGKLRGVKSLWR